MKRLNLLIVALATLSFVAFYSCKGTGEKATEEKTEVVEEAPAATEEVVEEDQMTTDSTAVEQPAVEEETQGEGE